MKHLTENDIKQAQELLASRVVRTPCVKSDKLSSLTSQRLGCQNSVEVFLKCENLQRTGSFKFRVALHCMLKLEEDQLRKGIVAYSTGNHAKGIAYAAATLSEEKGFGIPVTIVMTSDALTEKINWIRSKGATVLILDTMNLDECIRRAEAIEKTTGAILIPGSDHSDLVLGQGTATLEFLEQIEECGAGELDVIILPCGGGSLVSGAAIYYKDSRTQILAAEPVQGGARLAESRQCDRALETIPDPPTIADGLRGSFESQNWEVLRDVEYVRDVFTVSEEQIRLALEMAISAGFRIEPSSAIPLAALLYDERLLSYMPRSMRPWKVGIVLTGGNVSDELVERIIACSFLRDMQDPSMKEMLDETRISSG